MSVVGMRNETFMDIPSVQRLRGNESESYRLPQNVNIIYVEVPVMLLISVLLKMFWIDSLKMLTGCKYNLVER